MADALSPPALSFSSFPPVAPVASIFSSSRRLNFFFFYMALCLHRPPRPTVLPARELLYRVT